MNKKTLILCVILTVLSFLTIANFESAQAACDYPAYCDAGGTTCNGGKPCYIGNQVCSGPNTSTYTNCRCQGYGLADFQCTSGSQIGNECGPSDAYGNTPGVCGCDIQNTGCVPGCTDTYWASCGGGGTCGWGAWSSCSAPCGGGTQTRVNSCNGTVGTQACNTQACPVPTPQPSPPPGNPTPVPSPVTCSWGSWSACSASCGGGTRSRSDNCGNTQTEACEEQECPCTVGPWSACSATCGPGTQTRANNCEPGGIQTRACDTCTLSCACTAACGQQTACGTCSGGDYGAPGVVTLSPASGNLTIPTNRQVTLSWTSASLADNYDIQVFPAGTPAGQECTADDTFCATGLTTTNYTFTAPTGVVNYEWRVRANNTTCSAVDYMEAEASDEYLTSEGAAYNMVAANAVDGNDAVAWNAGEFAPQWVEIDMMRARTVSGIRMATNTFPAGNAEFEIYGGATTNPSNLIDTINVYSEPGDIYNITFSSPVPGVRYIRVLMTTSPSWVGWSELTPYYSDGQGNWNDGEFALVGPISGNVYLDTGFNAALNLATGLCEMGGALTGQNPGAGSSVGATWQGSGSTTGNITGSSYNIPNVPNYTNIGVQLNPDTTTWRCTCPFGCTYSGQEVPTSGVNFFIANVAQPWWQTQNGLVYAGSTTGNALVSQIPASCTGDCIGDFSYRNALSASESSGVVITGGGDIDTDIDPSLRYSRLREDSSQAHVIGSVYNGPRENYQYFYNLYSMGSSPTVDFNGEQPSTDPANGRAYYGSGNITVNAWHVTSDQSFVIFVNGNLTINDSITVDQGGFLAFIVSGNVTVANTVGVDDAAVTPPPATPTNVAVGKASSQSTTYPLPNTEASNGNDGDTNGDYANGSITHTLNDANAWWQVDLGESYDISEIRLHNRTDANQTRLTNYHILVSDDPFTSTNLATTLAQSGVSDYPNAGTAGNPSTANVNRTGRYVRVQLDGTNYLHLAELEVIGVPAGSGSGSSSGYVEGVYIADRIIIEGGRAGGDLKFVGAGTFVGWTSVTLGREYDDPFTNDSYPTEVFIFRPDFVSNVPERMTRPLYSWQETN